MKSPPETVFRENNYEREGWKENNMGSRGRERKESSHRRLLPCSLDTKASPENVFRRNDYERDSAGTWMGRERERVWEGKERGGGGGGLMHQHHAVCILGMNLPRGRRGQGV